MRYGRGEGGFFPKKRVLCAETGRFCCGCFEGGLVLDFSLSAFRMSRFLFLPDDFLSRREMLQSEGRILCFAEDGRGALSSGRWTAGKCTRQTSVAGRGRKVENFVYRRVTVCFNGRTKSSCRRLSAGLRASVVRRRGGERSVLPVAIFVRHPHGRSGGSGIRPDAGRVGECRDGTTCGRKDFLCCGDSTFLRGSRRRDGMTTEERIVPVSPCRCTRQRKTPKVAGTFPLCAGGAASGTDGAGELTMNDGCGSLPPCVPVTVGENTCRFAERFGRMKGREIFAVGG